VLFFTEMFGKIYCKALNPFCRKFDLGKKSFSLFAQSVSLIRPQPKNKQEIITYFISLNWPLKPNKITVVCQMCHFTMLFEFPAHVLVDFILSLNM